MKRWRFALLIWELFLFALILVLPQVDLPDFTFPGGTAPIVAKAKLSSPPTLTDLPAPAHTLSFNDNREKATRVTWLTIHLRTSSPPLLDSTLRC